MKIATIGTIIGIVSGMLVIFTLSYGFLFPVHENQIPVAKINAPDKEYVGVQVYFVSNSFDSDGTIVSYFWEFGDGATSSSKQPKHAFNEAKSYIVKLTVTDNFGDTDTTTKSIQISKKLTSSTTTPNRSIGVLP